MNDKFEIKIVASDKDYADAMSVRRQVFVDEQKIPQSKEFDGNDHSASHVLALDNGKPVGTMRIRYFNGFVKLERMCVLHDYRKTNLSELIMQKGMKFAAAKGFEKAYGVCKKELLNRWKRNGFEPIAGTNSVEQNGMSLIPVCCPLPKVENRITMNTPAEILNAKEGDWQFSAHSQDKENLQAGISNLLNRVRLLKKQPETKVNLHGLKYNPQNAGRDY